MCFVAFLRARFLILPNTPASLSKILQSMGFIDELFYSQILQLSAVTLHTFLLLLS